MFCKYFRFDKFLKYLFVIFLNFLIAEVSNTYERVKTMSQLQNHKLKASLSKNVFQIQYLFGISEEYKVIAIQRPPD